MDSLFQNRRQTLESLSHLRSQPLLVTRSSGDGRATTGLTLEESLRMAAQSPAAAAVPRLIDSAQASLRMLTQPIIAVLGELNAGKSSVVASFLTTAGQSRLPRGEESAQGTHRFVYWVPSDWLTSPAQKMSLLQLLAAVHGDRFEFLSEDREQAAEQYRSGRDHLELLQVPLIAADPALNQLGAALLDCPDVQTRDRTSVDVTGNPRLAFLCDASRICSALLVVWDRVRIRDGLLDDLLANLRQRKAAAPIWLLINRIRPERGQPTRTRTDHDLQRLLDEYQLPAQHCFGAFDFDIEARRDQPGWRELTPPALVARFDGTDQAEPAATESASSATSSATGAGFPQFFELGETEEANHPARISAERFLCHLPRQLDLTSLQLRQLEDQWQELRQQLRAALQAVEAWRLEQARHVAELHEGLLALCRRPFSDLNDQPLQLTTPDFSLALKESFSRTAPWYVRLPLSVAAPFERAISWATQRIGDVRQWLVRLREPREAFTDLTRQLGEELRLEGTEVANATTLAAEMRGLRWVPANADASQLERAWQTILSNLLHQRMEHSAEQLDRMTREVWEHLGVWQKTKAAILGLFRALGTVAAVGGLITALVDGGATLLVSYKLTATIAAYAPGIKALLIAGGGAAGAYVGFQLRAIELNTLPYLSRLFALACDAFAIPRQLGERATRVQFGSAENRQEFVLPDPQLASTPTIYPLDDARLWDHGPAWPLWRKELGDD